MVPQPGLHTGIPGEYISSPKEFAFGGTKRYLERLILVSKGLIFNDGISGFVVHAMNTC